MNWPPWRQRQSAAILAHGGRIASALETVYRFADVPKIISGLSYRHEHKALRASCAAASVRGLSALPEPVSNNSSGSGGLALSRQHGVLDAEKISIWRV